MTIKLQDIMQTQFPIGYTGSRGSNGYTGSQGYTGSKGDPGKGIRLSSTSTNQYGNPFTANPYFALSAAEKPLNGFVIGQPIYCRDVTNNGWFIGTVVNSAYDFIEVQGDPASTSLGTAQGVTATSSNWELTAVGMRGWSGYTGSRGANGYTGSQGPAGAGYTGSQGLPGVQGIQGPIGYTGSQGLPGADGVDGAQGLPGSDGAVGAQGPIGYTGSAGDDAIVISATPPANTNVLWLEPDALDEAAFIGYTGSQGIQGPAGPGFTGGVLSSTLTLKGLNETVVNLGSASGTISIDVTQGTVFKLTASGSITIDGLANATTGSSATIIIQQDATGSRALSSTMKFLGGTKTLSTAANAIDVINVFWDGTNYLATIGKDFK